ncbi:MAG: AbrB/MazE/SpoVT family DNA-binding domain-containing protein [Candidatus Nanohalobium sp.]
MTEIETEAKKWGNSIGVRIPKEAVEEEGIEPEDTVLIDVKKLRKPDEDAFGALSNWKVDAQDVKDELREEHGR